MGAQEDQQRFSNEIEKTKTSQSEGGPRFNFEAAAVITAGELLLEAALGILKALRSGALADREKHYRRLSADMDALMPAFYERYDEYLRAVLATGTEAIFCSKGCSACCSHYVASVEPFELIFLHGRLRNRPDYPAFLPALHKRESLFRSLLEKADDEAAEDKALYRYYLRNVSCPFLTEGGGCGIYALRPMSCRMFFSLSHPSLCKGRAVASPGNRNFIVELPEGVESVMAETEDLFAGLEAPDGLFGGLLRMNELFGRYD